MASAPSMIPLPPDEPANPVVLIALDAEEQGALGRLRAVLLSGDRGPAARRAAEDAIEVNAASYSAWQVLWECLLEGLAAGDSYRLLHAEMGHITEIGSENPKNYQVWNHRRKVALRIGRAQARSELAFTARVLSGDAKNYHAWAHRQCFVAAFGMWEGELAFAGALVAADVRNNSAWSHRAWVVGHMLEAGLRDEGLLREEVAWAAGQAVRAPENESVWSYLGFLLTRLPGVLGPVLDAVSQALAAVPGCPGALGLFVDCIDRAVGAAEQSLSEELMGALKARGRAACDALVESDPIRARYWTERRKALELI